MSGDINRVVIVGRLTRDAELSYTTSGFALTKFDVALNRRKKEGEQWVDEVNYFSIILWGKRGESLNQYLAKGQQIAVEGELRQERWEKDGVNRSRVTIECTNIQLLGGKNNDNTQQGNNSQGSQQQPSQKESQPFDSYAGGSSFKDDIPF